MMANGYSRNEANKIAASVAGAGRSYYGTWHLYKIKIDFGFNSELFATAMECVRDAIMGLSGSIGTYDRGILQSLNSIN